MVFSVPASFKEDFLLIGTWMLLNRNMEQPKQSMKEMCQFLNSLKSTIQRHQRDIEEIIKAQWYTNYERDASFDEAIVSIKTIEIKRLKNLLKDPLKYSKYYNNLDTTQFENLLNAEFEEDEFLSYDESDDEIFLDYDV